MNIATIGYEGLTIDSFFSILVRNYVQTLVDVREIPLSHKPGFSKTALSGWAAHYGIRYVHLPALGCPKDIRHEYRADGNWARYTQRFMIHLNRQEDAVEELAKLAVTERCCLMCFEADSHFCHRSYVAQAVARSMRYGVVIHHLAAAGTVSEVAQTILAGRPALQSAIDLSTRA